MECRYPVLTSEIEVAIVGLIMGNTIKLIFTNSVLLVKDLKAPRLFVKSYNTTKGTHPQKTIIILVNRINIIRRQTVALVVLLQYLIILIPM